MPHIYKVIGLMSGTACDGIDAAYIETDGKDFVRPGQGTYTPYEQEFSAQIVELTKGNLENLKKIENEITIRHVKAVKKLLDKLGMRPSEIDYLGFHGQSIAHDLSKKYTKQIGDIALLAKETGIKTVGDFRTCDVAAGGQGAPLVPIFLKALAPKKPMMFLNIGGVANIAYVAEDDLIGFDTGTGNAIINDYIYKHFGLMFDQDGVIASSGKVNEELLRFGLENPFFTKKFPKANDRNSFNEFAKLVENSLAKNDAVATLAEFTVQGVKHAIDLLPEKSDALIVSGGGRKNRYLMQRIEKVCGVKVIDIDSLGFDGDLLEAHAFGYLAVRSVLNLPISFPRTTNVPEPLSGGKLVNF